MSVLNDKIVDFTLCSECEFSNNKEEDEPCCDCLAIPARSGSVQPEYFKRAVLGLGKTLGKGGGG